MQQCEIRLTLNAIYLLPHGCPEQMVLELPRRQVDYVILPAKTLSLIQRVSRHDPRRRVGLHALEAQVLVPRGALDGAHGLGAAAEAAAVGGGAGLQELAAGGAAGGAVASL